VHRDKDLREIHTKVRTRKLLSADEFYAICGKKEKKIRKCCN
jgi:hypothetical protein